MSERKCIFNCELTIIKDERYQAFIKASYKRDDKELRIILQENKENNIISYFHRACASTYTSLTHINRYVKAKKRAAEAETGSDSSKRTRRSDIDTFSFKTDCIFCGQVCLEKDPRHPDRWRRYSRCRTVDRLGKATFKDVILDVCKLRNDRKANDVSLRLVGCVSDLHASDARYHTDCKKLFMDCKYVNEVSKEKADVFDDDVLDTIISFMCDDKSKIWNSVALSQLYFDYGGTRLSRRNVTVALCEYFGDDLIVLSSPGVANILVFREACKLNIVDALEEKVDGAQLAHEIRNETRKIDTSLYDLTLDNDTLMDGVSLSKSPFRSLQLSIAVLLKKKKYIDALNRFGITPSYDEFKLFKSSCAFHSSNEKIPKQLSTNNNLIQGVGDNFDCDIHSQNGLKQTHSMALILTQQEKSENSLKKVHVTIKRLKKSDIPGLKFNEHEISRYKGPVKPPMPQNEAVYKVMSLAVLARQAISIKS